MEYDEFIGRVGRQAQLPGGTDAERGCLATVRTLGEWVPGPLADAIAAQLPRQVGDPLRHAASEAAAGGQRFGNAGFVGQIAARAGVADDQAASIARAVLDALGAATEGGVMARVTETLPADLREYVTPPPGQEPWKASTGWVGPVVGRKDA
jgi:uncharacterized protein (DUF2267 family)